MIWTDNEKFPRIFIYWCLKYEFDSLLSDLLQPRCEFYLVKSYKVLQFFYQPSSDFNTKNNVLINSTGPLS